MKFKQFRRSAMVAAAVAIAVSGVSAQSTKRPQKQYSIEQFMNTVSITGASFSPDESRILFSSNKTGIWNAYTIPVTGGEWTPVTSSTTDSTFAVSYFPNDDRILFTRDQGGNELNHLYVRTADGQERDLTPGEKLKASFNGFTPDGSAFYVQSNKRDPRYFDIYRYDAKTYEATLFYQNDGYFPGAVSDDGKWVSLTKVITTANTDVYLWNADTKTVKHLTPHKGDAQYPPSSFDRESKYLYYTTNDGSEFARLRRYVLADGTHEDVEKANWDVLGIGFSKTGKYRVIAINEDGRTAIKVVDAAREAAGAAVAAVRRRCERDVREERVAAGVLRERGSLAERSVFPEAGRRQAGEADQLVESRDRSDRSRRHAGRPFQGARRHDDAEHPLEAAPGDGAEQGAGDRLGSRRPRRADDARGTAR